MKLLKNCLEFVAILLAGILFASIAKDIETFEELNDER